MGNYKPSSQLIEHRFKHIVSSSLCHSSRRSVAAIAWQTQSGCGSVLRKHTHFLNIKTTTIPKSQVAFVRKDRKDGKQAREDAKSDQLSHACYNE